MQPEWFSKLIIPGKLEFKNSHWVTIHSGNKKQSWSFNEEWKEYANTRQQKTWDMTAVERLEKFYAETKTTKEELAGKLILDAGCGNGQLTMAIATTGAKVTGIDRQLYLPDSNSNVQFVNADFDDPVFISESFDIIVANGSIHHTKNTFHSFQALADITKENGKLYVWVYKKQKGFQRLLLGALDLSRFLISRFPSWLQRPAVNILTFFFYVLSRIRKGENSKRSKNEIKINIYDAFTPRYRHYHSTEEVKNWFAKCGFSEMEVTHDNNKYGFGMLGTKSSKTIA